jgi:hypothetical protein
MMRKIKWMTAILAVPFLSGWAAAEGKSTPARVGGAVVSNQQLADRVAGAIQQSGMKDYDVSIETRSGEVTLVGAIVSEEQRSRMVEVATSVPGVAAVVDQLDVAPVKPVGLQAAEGQKAVEPRAIADFSGGVAPYSDAPVLPPYSWPAYTPYNNFASMAYQTQYPAGAWPFIGPPHPYPMIPSGWRHVSLRWRGGYWWLKFHAH